MADDATNEAPNNVLKFKSLPKPQKIEEIQPEEQAILEVDFAQESEVRTYDDYPHRVVEIKCSACDHEWSEICPADHWDNYKCPECSLHRGLAKYTAIYPKDWDERCCETCGFYGFRVARSPTRAVYLCCAQCATLTPLIRVCFDDQELDDEGA